MNYSAKYDLVAVSNHYGSFYGGHCNSLICYSFSFDYFLWFKNKNKDDTFAKNEISQKWYRFNDNYVQEICKSKLCVSWLL